MGRAAAGHVRMWSRLRGGCSAGSEDDGIEHEGLCDPEGRPFRDSDSIEVVESFSFPDTSDIGGESSAPESSRFSGPSRGESLSGKKRERERPHDASDAPSDKPRSDPRAFIKAAEGLCRTDEQHVEEMPMYDEMARTMAKWGDEEGVTRAELEQRGFGDLNFRPLPPGRRALLQRMMDAACCGDTVALGKAIEEGADVNYLSITNASSLHGAALGGHVEAMHVLLAAGADATARDDFNQSCLHLAAQSASLPAVRFLVEEVGVDMSWITLVGDTARDQAMFEAEHNLERADNLTHFYDPPRAARSREIEAYLASKGCAAIDWDEDPEVRMGRAAKQWDPVRSGYCFEGHSILDDPNFENRAEIRRRPDEDVDVHEMRVEFIREEILKNKERVELEEGKKQEWDNIDATEMFDTAGLIFPRPVGPNGTVWRDPMGQTLEDYDAEIAAEEKWDRDKEKELKDTKWNDLMDPNTEKEMHRLLKIQEKEWNEEADEKRKNNPFMRPDSDDTSDSDKQDLPRFPKMVPPKGWDENEWTERAISLHDQDMEDMERNGWTQEELCENTARLPPRMEEMPRPGSPDPEYQALLEENLDWAEKMFGERPVSIFELADHPELLDDLEKKIEKKAGGKWDPADELTLDSEM